MKVTNYLFFFFVLCFSFSCGSSFLKGLEAKHAKDEQGRIDREKIKNAEEKRDAALENFPEAVQAAIKAYDAKIDAGEKPGKVEEDAIKDAISDDIESYPGLKEAVEAGTVTDPKQKEVINNYGVFIKATAQLDEYKDLDITKTLLDVSSGE